MYLVVRTMYISIIIIVVEQVQNKRNRQNIIFPVNPAPGYEIIFDLPKQPNA